MKSLARSAQLPIIYILTKHCLVDSPQTPVNETPVNALLTKDSYPLLLYGSPQLNERVRQLQLGGGGSDNQPAGKSDSS